MDDLPPLAQRQKLWETASIEKRELPSGICLGGSSQVVKTSLGWFGGVNPPNEIRIRRQVRRIRALRKSIDSKQGALQKTCSAPSGCQKTSLGGLEGRSPPNVIRIRRHVRRMRKPCLARFPCAVSRPSVAQGGEGNAAKRQKKDAAGRFFRYTERSRPESIRTGALGVVIARSRRRRRRPPRQTPHIRPPEAEPRCRRMPRSWSAAGRRHHRRQMSRNPAG